MTARAVASKAEFLEILRARAVALRATREQLDETAGFATGYAGKLLGARQVRSLVNESLWQLLQALGLRLVIEEDPAAVEALKWRYARRRDFPCNAAEHAQNLRTEIANAVQS